MLLDAKNAIARFTVLLMVIGAAFQADAKPNKPRPTKPHVYGDMGNFDPTKIAAAIQKDPFGYFKTELKEHATNLQRKAFLNTLEGKERLKELHGLLKSALDKSYEVSIGYPGTFDVDGGYFPVFLEHASGPTEGGVRGCAKTADQAIEYGQSISGVWLPEKLFKVQVNTKMGMIRRLTFVDVPEDAALGIEKARGGGKVSLRFNLTGKVHMWRGSDAQCMNIPFPPEAAIMIKDVTVVFTDKSGRTLHEQPLK